MDFIFKWPGSKDFFNKRKEKIMEIKLEGYDFFDAIELYLKKTKGIKLNFRDKISVDKRATVMTSASAHFEV